MRRGTGCADAQPQAKRKTMTGKTVQGRAVCLVMDFMLKPLPSRRICFYWVPMKFRPQEN